MASVMQGDAYSIPVTIKSGNGTLITPEIAACVEITVGQFTKRWPGQVTFDEKTGEWQFPVTQKQTFRFAPGAAVVQARVVFQDGSIMGGSGAPIRVAQSVSRGTLPQPEKTETTTGSTPKATEVTIPTVHDINVFLHSQVILSDPIKAPYIGDNGNWYEYDAATGEFVDTGVKAGGSADLSLGITGATVGQIAKITEVDTDGKPTAWEAVDMGGGETWEKIAEIELRADTAKYVLADFATWRKAKVIMTRPQWIGELRKNVWCKVAWDTIENAYNCGYMTIGYGYVFWEFSAEVNELFITSEQVESNNPNIAVDVRSRGTLTPLKAPIEKHKFELFFTDTSVIQDGDKVTVIGVRR